ncbi:MAG: N-acetylmuramoyl-L-alanine amidase [Cytophagales bacterium]|nr:MAG: N-acetylmuramoyl-L-alanine amidase [Cytophagales bacterium]TAF62359.1 MAG: N-acetylmuramoyl-L-alanine amidase [Cytophagales bacterium]
MNSTFIMRPYLSCVLLLCALSFLSTVCVQDSFILEKKLISLKCSSPRAAGKEVSFVMIHYCSDAVESPSKPYSVEKITSVFERYGVSAHYLVDRDGKVYQLVEENRTAFHAGKGKLPFAPYHENSLNGISIGIELMAIGTRQEMKLLNVGSGYDKIAKTDIGFTEMQYKTLRALLNDIQKRHPKVLNNRKHIVGHDEYAPSRRPDPGSLFEWSKIGL